MHDWVLSVCRRLEQIQWLIAIDESRILSTFMYVAHYFTVFLIVGTSAIVDLGLLGVGGRRQTVPQLAEQLLPLMWIALGINLVTGFIMFAPDATTFFPRVFFWIKLPVVLLAVVFALIVQRNVPRWEQSPGRVPKLMALLSLALWIGAVWTAVEIPNY
jgi:hypothetical protein